MNSFLVTFLIFTLGLSGLSCSIFATRPVQEMSDTSAALRAAKEVQAETLSPELFRQANEWFFKAKREYKFKNFKLAQEYAEKARIFAEQAEFESIRNGGNRTELIPDPLANPALGPSQPIDSAPQKPYAYPTPTGVPAEPFGQPSPSAPPPGPPGPQSPPAYQYPPPP